MTNKINIAYMVSLFPCWSETFILREIQELTSADYDVSIFSLKKESQKLIHPDAKQFLSKTKYPSIFTSLSSFFCFLFTHPVTLIKIIYNLIQMNNDGLINLIKTIGIIPRVLNFMYFVKKNNILHIHAHWATIPTSAVWIINYILNHVKYSFTAHAYDIWNNNKMLSEKINSAKFVATISDFNKKILSKYVSEESSKKIQVVHCGINVEEFAYKDPSNSKIVQLLSVGRYIEKKGFKYLIDACEILHQKNVNYRCLIVGDGPQREFLQERINSKKLSKNVMLTGAMSQEKLKDLFLQSDIFVLPAVKASDGDLDGIPVVLMEAMALGLPVISTKVSGIPELIEEGKNGLLVDPNNEEQLASAIESLSSFSETNILFAKNARQTIEKEFNIKKSAQMMIDQIFC